MQIQLKYMFGLPVEQLQTQIEEANSLLLMRWRCLVRATILSLAKQTLSKSPCNKVFWCSFGVWLCNSTLFCSYLAICISFFLTLADPKVWNCCGVMWFEFSHFFSNWTDSHMLNTNLQGVLSSTVTQFFSLHYLIENGVALVEIINYSNSIFYQDYSNSI